MKDQIAGENVLPARVREIQFAGATSSLKLDADGLVLEALVLGPGDFSVGDSCTVTLPPERIALLKE
jgi:hypothetical protein